MNDAIRQQFDILRDVIRGYDNVLIAFSGGVDSSLLLKVASDELGERCHAFTCVSPTMARSEIDDARRLGEEYGLGARHHIVESNELARPGFAQNPTDRCALCKTELMSVAEPLALSLGAPTICLGTNVDDLGDFRPGVTAARDLGAKSPFVEAGLDKNAVREISRALGLRTWNKPQLACLSSRFPYGTEITPDRLRRVDEFEDSLRALGFRQLRVRFHDAIARIEIDVEDLTAVLVPATRERIVTIGKELGFSYVTIDLAGFRSGSMNDVLVPLRKRGVS